MIEKYFGRIPSHEKPDERTTTEPPQNSERRVVLHRDSATALPRRLPPAGLPQSRRCRVRRHRRSHVRRPHFAAVPRAGARQENRLRLGRLTGMPGNKYPHLFAFYAFPLPGHKPDEMARGHPRGNRKAQERRHQRRRTEDDQNPGQGEPDPQPGQQLRPGFRARHRLRRATTIGENLFREVDRIDKITKADIRRVANKTFTDNNRTVGIIETTAPASAEASQGGAQ